MSSKTRNGWMGSRGRRVGVALALAFGASLVGGALMALPGAMAAREDVREPAIATEQGRSAPIAGANGSVAAVPQIAVAQPAAGVAWHVATSGADTVTCGTQSQPCASVSWVLDPDRVSQGGSQVGPGDVIQLASGTFEENVVVKNKNITIRGDAKGQSTIANPATLGAIDELIGTLAETSISAVATADFNADGWMDLAVANSGSGGSTRVYLHDKTVGAGVNPFLGGPDVTITQLGDTRALVAADFNGDGLVDLAEGNEGAATIIYLNDSMGGFAAGQPALVTQTNATRAIALGDVNGDGILDLIEGNSNQANRVYISDGQGSFTDGGTVTADADDTHGIASADLDGDGSVDIVTANFGGSGEKNRLYLNNGQGAFPSGFDIDPTATNQSSSAALADIDGDGDVDVIFGNDGSTNRLYLSNGTALPFSGVAGSDVTTDSHATQALAIGNVDANADGFPDVFVSNAGSPDTNYLYVNSGLGGADPFSGTVGITLGLSASQIGSAALALADFDNDGDLDIVDAGGSTVNLWRNGLDVSTGRPLTLEAGDGRPLVDAFGNTPATKDITPTALFPAPQSNTSSAVGDIDLDGDLDLVIGQWNGNYYNDYDKLGAKVLLNTDGEGSFAQIGELEPLLDSIYFFWYDSRHIALADHDNDGDLDLYVGSRNCARTNIVPLFGRYDCGGGVLIYRNGVNLPPAGSSSGNPNYPFDTQPLFVDNGFSVYGGPNVHGLITGNFDNDAGNLTDFAYGTLSGGQNLRVCVQTSLNIFSCQWSGLNASSWALEVADLNGDGFQDIVSSGDTNEAEFILFNNGSSPYFDSSSTTLRLDEGEITRDVEVADFNGDGFEDILYANDGAGCMMHIFLHSGDVSDPFTFQDRQFVDCAPGLRTEVNGEGAFSLDSGDVDADGDIDFLVGFRNRVGPAQSTRIYLNNGSNSAPFAGVMGVPIDAGNADRSDLELADINGDGWLDAVLPAQTKGASKTVFNNGAASFSGSGYGLLISEVTSVVSTTDMVVADLNNDGYPDVVNVFSDGVPSAELYTNNGTGSPFEGVIPSILNVVESSAVAVGDLNGDQFPDIVLASRASMAPPTATPPSTETPPWTQTPPPTITPTLTPPSTLTPTPPLTSTPDPTATSTPTPTPFNGVSYTDKVIFNSGQQGVANPFSGMTVTELSDIPRHTNAVIIGEFTGDTMPDVVLGNGGSQGAQLNYLIENTGNDPVTGFSTFAAGDASWSENKSTYGLASGFVDDDDKLDLVSANGTQGLVLYTGTQTAPWFSAGVALVAANDSDDVRRVGLADVDGDGRADLVVASNAPGKPSRVYLNTGTSPFFTTSSVVDLPDTGMSRDIAAQDVNGDGLVDMVIANVGSANRVYVQGADAQTWNGRDISAGMSDTLRIAIADANGDDIVDVFAGHADEVNTLHLNERRSVPYSGGDLVNPVGDDTQDVAFADVDGDGDLDIFAGNGGGRSIGQADRLQINDGTGTYGDPIDIGTDRDRTQAIAVGDIDGDGSPDVVAGIGGNAYDYNKIYLHRGTGPNPYLGVAGVIIGDPDASTDRARTSDLALLDVDSDGDLDLVVANKYSPNRLYYNAGGQLAGSSGLSGDEISGESDGSNALAIADVNGDGQLDLVVANQGSNKVFVNDGAGAFVPAIQASGDETFGPSGNDSTGVALGDIDADGDVDAVFSNDGDPDSIYFNDGTGRYGEPITITGRASNLSSDVVLADVDGDNDLDLIVSYEDQPKDLFLNDGGANPFGGDPVGVDPFAGATSLAMGDVDGDQDLDILTGRSGLGDAGRNTLTFNVKGSRVLVEHVTLSRGSTDFGGGALSRFGTLSFVDSRVANNVASTDGGGIWLDRNAAVTMLRTTVERNTAKESGGGIYLGARATSRVLDEVHIRNNTALYGGGLYSASPTRLEDSTLDGNRATLHGGALSAHADVEVQRSTISFNTSISGNGGAAHIAPAGTLKLINSTASHNVAGLDGGAIYNEGFANLRFNTFVGNAVRLNSNHDPGLVQGVTLYNGDGATAETIATIYAEPLVLDTLNPLQTVAENCNATLSTQGNNRVFPGRVSAAGGQKDGSCGLSVDEELTVAHQLGPLAENGGPTRTHRPLKTDTTILDVVPPTSCEVDIDQRERDRPSIGLRDAVEPRAWCDVGSVEIGAATLFVCGPPLSRATHRPRCTFLSVRDAMAQADQGDTIVVSGIVTESVVINKDVVLTGPRKEDGIEPGTHMGFLQFSPFAPRGLGLLTGTVVSVQPSISATISNLNIRHGDGQQGGGVRNDGNLLLEGVTIYDNAAVDGGGVYNNGDLRVINSTITTNSASGDGGGLFNSTNGTSDLHSVTLADNGTGANRTFGGGDTRAGAIGVITTGVGSDSFPDLVVARDSSIWLHNGKGTGAFEDAVDLGSLQLSAGDVPLSVAMTNVNATGAMSTDLVLDLIVGHRRGSPRLYKGKATGGFEAPVLIDPAQGDTELLEVKSLEVLDVNGDGHVDVVAGTGFSSHNNQLYLGNGDGTFQAAVDIGGAGDDDETEAIAIGDVDDDGDPDLIVATAGTGTAHKLYENDGTAGVFANGVDIGDDAAMSTADKFHGVSIAIGDLIGDTKPDVVIGNLGGQFWLFEATGNLGTQGGFEDGVRYGDANDGLAVRALAVADFDGDGLNDVAAGFEAPKLKTFHPNNGDDTLRAGAIPIGTDDDPIDEATVGAMLVAVLDGDTLPELVGLHLGLPDKVYLNLSASSPDEPFKQATTGPNNIHNSSTISGSVTARNSLLRALEPSPTGAQCTASVSNTIFDGGGNFVCEEDCFNGGPLAMPNPTPFNAPREGAGGLLDRARSGIARLFGRESASAPAPNASDGEALDAAAPAQTSGDVTPIGSWTRRTDVPAPRSQHGAALLGDGQRILVTGGKDPAGAAMTDTTIVDFISNAPPLNVTDLGEGRFAHTTSRVNLEPNQGQDPVWRVLVAGGRQGVTDTTILDSTELYTTTPSPSGLWDGLGDLNFARSEHVATELSADRAQGVLVTGGTSPAGAYMDTTEVLLLDQIGLGWIQVADLNVARNAHAAALVTPDQYIIVIGGEDATGVLSSTEKLNGSLTQWSTVGNLNVARKHLTATPLTDGRVLATGGTDASGNPLKSAEMYDPATEMWTIVAPMGEARTLHTATLLDDGRVLVVGGKTTGDMALGTAEIYDPATDTWTPTNPMVVARYAHSATKLSDGRVVVVGGIGLNGEPIPAVEIFDPNANPLVGTPCENAVGPLRDNGGPTLTRALPKISPAIDAGLEPEDCDRPIDQRGSPRFKGARCDAGAYEEGANKIRVCPTCQADGDQLVFNDLQTALLCSLGGDTICLDPGTYTGDFLIWKDTLLTHNVPDLNEVNIEDSVDIRVILQHSPLSIEEQRQQLEVLRDPTDLGTVLTVKAFDYPAAAAMSPITDSADVSVTLRALTIRHGFNIEGGGIHNVGRLTILTSTIHDNAAVNRPFIPVAQQREMANQGKGGGIFNKGELDIVRSTLSHNRAEGAGGAIYVDGSANIGERDAAQLLGTTLDHNTLARNEAVRLGLERILLYTDDLLSSGGSFKKIDTTFLSGDRIVVQNKLPAFLKFRVDDGIADKDVCTVGGQPATKDRENPFEAAPNAAAEPIICVVPEGRRSITVKITASEPNEADVTLSIGEPPVDALGHNIFVANQGRLEYGGSIVTNESLRGGQNCDVDNGGSRVTSSGGSLVSDTSCSNAPSEVTTNDDLRLGPLQDNNLWDFETNWVGGCTWTHALLPGSTAIDRIEGTTCTNIEIHPSIQISSTIPITNPTTQIVQTASLESRSIQQGDVLTWQNNTPVSLTVALNDGEADMRLVTVGPNSTSAEVGFDDVDVIRYRVYEHRTLQDIVSTTLDASIPALITVTKRTRELDQRGVILAKRSQRGIRDDLDTNDGTMDQRGMAYRCDVGAVEFAPWIVGEPVPVPLIAIVTRQRGPSWHVGPLDQLPQDDVTTNPASDYDVWSTGDLKDRATRPTVADDVARITYIVSSDPQAIPLPTMNQIGIVEWPDDPQLHVSGSIVYLSHDQLADEFRAATGVAFEGDLKRSEGATVVNGIFSRTLTITETEPAHTVFKLARGNDDDATIRVRVAETVRPLTPGIRDVRTNVTAGNAMATNCVLGDELFYFTLKEGDTVLQYGHQDPEERNGMIVSGDSFDGVRETIDLASVVNTIGNIIPPQYNREDRTGPIIPISNTAPAPYITSSDPLAADGPIFGQQDIEVAWFRNDDRNVSWPVRSVGYRCDWPDDPNEIIIASELGSEIFGQPILDPERFGDITVYNQQDPAEPGYNPNEEHALLAPSNMGNPTAALYALRNDLSPTDNEFALLKFRDLSEDGRVRIVPYKVRLTKAAQPITVDQHIDGKIFVVNSDDQAYGVDEIDAQVGARLRAESGTVTDGGRVVVPIEVLGVNDLRTMTATLKFDPTYLEPVRCIPNRLDFVERLNGLGLEVAPTTRVGDSTLMTGTLTSGTDAIFEWDFDDGGPNRVDGAAVSPAYLNAGNYSVEVTATNGVWDDKLNLTAPITVTNFSTDTHGTTNVGQPQGCRVVGGDTLVFEFRTRSKFGLSGNLTVTEVEFEAKAQPPTNPTLLEWDTAQTKLMTPAFEKLQFAATAGNPIFAPTPMRGLLDIQSCPATKPVDSRQQPFWKDFKGQVWARAAGDLDILYYYPMQEGFALKDADVDDINAELTIANASRDPGDEFELINKFDPNDPLAQVGQCVPWLNKTTEAPTNTDAETGLEVLPTGYLASWPALPPLMTVGETVYERAKSGVSGVAGQQAVTRIFDALAPGEWSDTAQKVTVSGREVLSHTAQIVHPLRDLRVKLDLRPRLADGSPDANFNYSLPSDIKTQRLPFGGGLAILGDSDNNQTVPFSLKSRITFDENTGELVFKGYYDGASPEYIKGDPLLLLNVLSRANKERLQSLCASDGASPKDVAGDIAAGGLDDQLNYGYDAKQDKTGCKRYKAAIEELFHKSHNPRQLDLCRVSTGDLWDPVADAGIPGTAVIDPISSADGTTKITEGKDAGTLPQNYKQSCNDSGTAYRDGVPDRPAKGLLIGLQDVPTVEDSLAGQRLARSRTDDDLEVDDVRLNDGLAEPMEGVGKGHAFTAGAGQGVGFTTLAYNNDPNLGALPVSLQVIKVGCTKDYAFRDSTYRGNVLAITSDNLFDEKLTMRHTGDFGGDPDLLPIKFEWYIAPVDDTAVSPTTLPPNYPWQRWTKKDFDGEDARDEITIEGANPTTLRDNWIIARYKGYPVCGNQVRFSNYAGDPSAKPSEVRAQLAEGWIKRVTKGLNPFDARVTDFLNSPINTDIDMVRQAGPRFEGPIPLTNDPVILNSVGLIEAYETVLQRGRVLSIDSNINDQGANAALVNVASRIADLYGLLSNTAYIDALDPTVGFGADSEFQSNAPTLFAFMNQFRSDEFGLIDEELALLRGRDEVLGGVAAGPTYNRLTWNFSNGDGEVAYVQNYNIRDANKDGFVDEVDGQTWFPQGHGDAWGHALTALDEYYDLLRHPFFTWIPRAEPISVAGAPLVVDYYDERRFAKIAAQKAKIGANIVDLAYRKHWADPERVPRADAHEDPSSTCERTYASYAPAVDNNCELRAWGVDDWAKRAGQGAYLDWVVVNSMLPPEEERFSDVRRIDRTTVPEVGGIADEALGIQEQIDKLDQNLNPLGIPNDAVLFDMDPSLIEVGSGIQGETHFDQVYKRSVNALDSALALFTVANTNKNLRREKEAERGDLVDEIIDTDIAFINELIDVFGLPYTPDVGTNGTYPEGYEGPDIYNYDLWDRTELVDWRERCTGNEQDEGVCGREAKTYVLTQEALGCFPFLTQRLADIQFGDDLDNDTAKKFFCTGPPAAGDEDSKVIISHVVGTGLDAGRGRFKPDSWPVSSVRPAYGSIQDAIKDLYQARLEYELAIGNYQGHIGNMVDFAEEIRDTADTMDGNEKAARDFGIAASVFEGIVFGLSTASAVLSGIADSIDGAGDAVGELVPENAGFTFSVGSPAEGAISAAFEGVVGGLQIAALAVDGIAGGIELGVGIAERFVELGITEDENDLEIRNMKRAMAAMLRDEQSMRLELFMAEDAFIAAQGDYDTEVQRGFRLLRELVRLRKRWAGQITEERYGDSISRIFYHDALSKYREYFDFAQQLVYMTAVAYDYDTNLSSDGTDSGLDFRRSIVGTRSLGQITGDLVVGNPEPVAGAAGLGDSMARMLQNYAVLRGQLGLNNPQNEASLFSLRHGLFRLRDDSDAAWRNTLQKYYVRDIWSNPNVMRKAKKPFGIEGRQPGLVIPFESTVMPGMNFFANPLGGGDLAYDPTQISTKILDTGIFFEGYDDERLAATPRVYLLPAGKDVLRPRDDEGILRFFDVEEVLLPLPLPIANEERLPKDFVLRRDGLEQPMYRLKKHGRMRAYPVEDPDEVDPGTWELDTRLVGRSVWNTKWLLVIPGDALHSDRDLGLDRFIEDVNDIHLWMTTYATQGATE